MGKLFCDLKTDEEKAAFFLSGRGYETGVIAHSIQNDVAMAYHRCAEYKKELAALQAECEKLLEALEQIERWDGFPSTGKTWEGSGEPVSYGAAFGSNGERDFMREVARKALAAHRKGEDKPCQECGGDGAGGEHEEDCAMIQGERLPATT